MEHGAALQGGGEHGAPLLLGFGEPLKLGIVSGCRYLLRRAFIYRALERLRTGIDRLQPPYYLMGFLPRLRRSRDHAAVFLRTVYSRLQIVGDFVIQRSAAFSHVVQESVAFRARETGAPKVAKRLLPGRVPVQSVEVVFCSASYSALTRVCFSV